MKSKGNVFTPVDIIEIVMLLLIIAELIYIFKTGNTLYVFGYFIPYSIFFYISFAVFFAVVLATSVSNCVISFRKDKKKIGSGILSIITTCLMFIVFTMRMTLTDSVTTTYEIIDLSDSKVCINERGSYNTYLDVYQINGIIAKSMTGKMNTDFPSQNCIENGKWYHTYNESDKKLTIMLYDNADGNDEDGGTEFTEYEFTLK